MLRIRICMNTELLFRIRILQKMKEQINKYGIYSGLCVVCTVGLYYEIENGR